MLIRNQRKFWILCLALGFASCASLETAKIYLQDGNKAEDRGDLATALDFYKKATDEYEEFPDGWNNQGMIYARQQKFDQAERSFRKAIALDPGHAGAWYNLGRMQEQQGDTEEAILSYQKVLAIDSKHAAARVNLARIYLKNGAKEKGRQELELAVENSPEYAPAHFNLGRLLYQSGDTPGALKSFRKGCELKMPASCENAKYMQVLLVKPTKEEDKKSVQ